MKMLNSKKVAAIAARDCRKEIGSFKRRLYRIMGSDVQPMLLSGKLSIHQGSVCLIRARGVEANSSIYNLHQDHDI